MARLTLKFEPYAVEGVPDPAEAATWGRLYVELAIEERVHVLTRVFDRRANGQRDGVDGTILPIAEWMARSWFSIFETEQGPPDATSSRRAAYRWRRGHCLRHAGEGTALPDLCVWRTGEDLAALAWSRDAHDAAPWEPVEFLSQGKDEVPEVDVRSAFGDLIALVLRRCQESVPDHPRVVDLVQAWELAVDPSHPERPAAVLAARLGEPWAHLGSTQRQLVRELRHTSVATQILAEVADLDHADSLRRAVETVEAVMSSRQPVVEQLRRLRASLRPARDGRVWDRGWRDADSLRSLTGHSHDTPFRPDRLGELAEDQASDLYGLLEPRVSFVGWQAGCQPVRFAAGAPSSFRVLRDQWPVLFAGAGERSEGFLLGPPLLRVTPVANAFATELVAPHRAVAKELGGRRVVDEDEVEQIARKLEAPWSCVRHQVENHGLARILFEGDG